MQASTWESPIHYHIAGKLGLDLRLNIDHASLLSTASWLDLALDFQRGFLSELWHSPRADPALSH